MFIFNLNKFIKAICVIGMIAATLNASAGTAMEKEDIEKTLKQKTGSSLLDSNQPENNNQRQNNNTQQDETTVTNLFSEDATYENFESHEHEDDMKQEFFEESRLEP